MIKTNRFDLVIAATSFFILTFLITSLYFISKDNYNAIIEEDIRENGEFLAKEFENIIRLDISRLENLKSRLEYTNGEYFSNWEHDAELLLKQNPSFKFIEWIDSTMTIRKINPLKGNEKVLNFDLSRLDYRNKEWHKHAKNKLTNVTSWVELTQSGHAILVDAPVYFNNKFQGTITAGMNFKTNFDRIVNYLEDKYAIKFYDDKGSLFYTLNEPIILEDHNELAYKKNILIDEGDNQSWQLEIYPSKNFLMHEGHILLNIALIIGLFLALILSSLIFFYLRAVKNSKIVTESNTRLTKLNEVLKQETERANKASQAKTEFLSNMSHEIRTPLHAIIGFIELLKNANLNAEHKEYLSFMDKSSGNLLNLVNDILDFNKIESGHIQLEEIKFTPLNKVKEVLKVNDFQFTKKNLYLNTIYNGEPGIQVVGDINKFIQVVNNLIKNAYKFTNEGGVTVGYCESVIGEQLKVIINVLDTGIGIPKDKINSIFNQFTQLENSIVKHYEGSGLGLTISKNLAALMGGDITVESEEGKGSKFTASFLFNIAEKQNTDKDANINKVLNVALNNVLIVDDNKLNIVVLKKFLKEFDINPDVVYNGQAAVDSATQKKYQLIFMDIHMPVMDGWEATKLIRENDKEVIIFGLSANVTTQAINQGIENGMNNYLTKPFKKDMLYKLLLFYFGKTEPHNKKAQQ
ncbi:response regulator [Aestuariibaculum sediminum]|uniref:histidine kinase n=1 Tax=Aestuariibaculum sediminum TaxID=2770637 RepID=A0A8J6Q2G6_9FLAO|nr:response regulator [Aestuariibaculum sediminum]MBD0833617.1 response regulator [Aestuariibaculum sediminum]